MDMRKYITKRLDGMKSVTEKNILRDIMEDIFIPMYNHMEAEYIRLSDRVREEMPLQVRDYVILSTLMERENAEGGCPYLFPVDSDDLEKPGLDISEIYEKLKGGEEVRIDTVFAEADYLVCKEITGSREIFDGTIKTDGGNFSIGVKLKSAGRYKVLIQNLYRLFISNGIPWQTVNSPHIFKMFDVMLFRLDFESKEAQDKESREKEAACKVQSFDISYGKYAEYIKENLVPVWNIKKMTISSKDFPLPSLDKVNYEYMFDLTEEGSEHGYLADYGDADISAVRREKNTLIVTSPAAKGLVWDMYKVMKRRESVTDHFPYELMGNGMEDSFSARMIASYGATIKTNAELRRLLEAYDVSGYVELDAVQVLQGTAFGETYEVNNFLKDEIRDLAAGNSLLLKFRPLKRNSYIVRDIMSFLVSQAQIVYPEFRCVGVLI